MRTALDNYLGIHPQALQLESKRNELLAANLANVDTPNYKARDIDFKSALAAASGPGNDNGGASGALPLRAPSAGSSSAASSQSGNGVAASGTSAQDPASGLDASLLKYRVPMSPALDGNTVDEQLEQSAFAENSVRYQASLTFLNSALRDLMTAITGS
jgi:flagellar basal-body rod protein FlgB